MKEREYRFLGDWGWLYRLEGFGDSRSCLYRLYIGGICCWNLLVMGTSTYSAYLVMPDKARAIDGFHSALIAMFALGGLVSWLLTRRGLHSCGATVTAGFYRYPDHDPEVARLEASVGGEVHRRGKHIFWAMAVGALANIVFFPLSQLMLVTAEEYEAVVDFSNPYLPHYLYLPWSTRSLIGLFGGMLVHMLIFVYTYGIAISMNEVYISCAVQLIVQLKILNHSIRMMRTRALCLHQERHGKVPDDERDPAFQDCLQTCLIHNIHHHQVLIRYTAWFKPFIGSCFLLIVVLASIIFASIFYLLMKKPPVNYIICYMMGLFSEQSYTFYMCYFGERIMEESGQIFESLYSIEWYDADIKFGKTLQIFRIFTRRPIRVKSHLLNFYASLESYGDFMSAMYKIMNIMRQSDKK